MLLTLFNAFCTLLFLGVSANLLWHVRTKEWFRFVMVFAVVYGMSRVLLFGFPELPALSLPTHDAGNAVSHPSPSLGAMDADAMISLVAIATAVLGFVAVVLKLLLLRTWSASDKVRALLVWMLVFGAMLIFVGSRVGYGSLLRALQG